MYSCALTTKSEPKKTSQIVQIIFEQCLTLFVENQARILRAFRMVFFGYEINNNNKIRTAAAVEAVESVENAGDAGNFRCRHGFAQVEYFLIQVDLFST